MVAETDTMIEIETATETDMVVVDDETTITARENDNTMATSMTIEPSAATEGEEYLCAHCQQHITIFDVCITLCGHYGMLVGMTHPFLYYFLRLPHQNCDVMSQGKLMLHNRCLLFLSDKVKDVLWVRVNF